MLQGRIAACMHAPARGAHLQWRGTKGPSLPSWPRARPLPLPATGRSSRGLGLPSLPLTRLCHDPLVGLRVGRLQPPQHLLELVARQPHVRPVVLLQPVLVVDFQVVFYIVLLGPTEAAWWVQQGTAWVGFKQWREARQGRRSSAA